MSLAIMFRFAEINPCFIQIFRNDVHFFPRLYAGGNCFSDGRGLHLVPGNVLQRAALPDDNLIGKEIQLKTFWQ